MFVCLFVNFTAPIQMESSVLQSKWLGFFKYCKHLYPVSNRVNMEPCELLKREAYERISLKDFEDFISIDF